MGLPVDSTAMVLTAPRTIEVARFALPQIGADDGLLRVEACGLCGADHELYSGHLPTRGPVIPGHETVGVIEAGGEVAARRWDVAVGDRVALECFSPAGSVPRAAVARIVAVSATGPARCMA